MASEPEGPEGADDPLRRETKAFPDAKRAVPSPVKASRSGLSGGLAALAAAEYATAETELTAAAKRPEERGPALLGLAGVAVETGRYGDSVRWADEAVAADAALRSAAAPIKGQALARQGKVDEAVRVCEAVKGDPAARRARLLLGELQLRQGKRALAESVLMTIVNDFNRKTIAISDGEGMSLVGRATHLLRSKRDANEAYDDAERAGHATPELFLWRAELFLEAYNYGRAEEMVRRALTEAPDLPAAHVRMAQVRLAQTLDFDAADQEIDRALATNRALPEAYAIRAGLRLRDLEIQEAERALADGMAVDPTDLDLLSMKAAVRFLADDQPGFLAATRAVLTRNGSYARLYQLVAEYAEWEHRYSEIVGLMNEAVKLDPGDGRSFAALGLNQLRLGNEPAGVASLDRAFRLDKFNVRVFNTLNLYERDIPVNYVSVDHHGFHLRYPKAEKPMLERYVPPLLDEAWASLVQRYGATPTTPVGVEIYGSREHFSVRTSGLPNIGIQGVCFGSTLAAVSPKAEAANWGNVLWHELGHVFAIQLSKSHVPRWFTEGLSEYETLVRRPEWRRSEDPALFLALRRGRVPAIERLNRAFTHAGDEQDMTTAYYAASQVTVFLAESFGLPRVVTMLRAWGEGQRTPEVIQGALGVNAAELDRRFRAWLEKRLVRYQTQFVPDVQPKALAAAEKTAREKANDANAQADLALAALAAGDTKKAATALEQGRRLALPRSLAQGRLRYLAAKVYAQGRDLVHARQELEAMTREGHDGYAVRMLLGDLAQKSKETPRAVAEWEAAAKFDPTQAEPLQSLADQARRRGDGDSELAALRRLAPLSQHDRRVWRRLLTRLVERHAWTEAKAVGQSALFVDVHSAETHALYAEALVNGGAPDPALFEGESALLGEGLSAELASQVHVTRAQAYLAKGDGIKARAARDEALRQNPNNRAAQGLRLP